MTEQKKEITTPKKQKNSAKGLASISFFVALLDKLGNYIYDAFIFGFFGRIFTSYSKIQKKFERGLCGRLFWGSHKIKKFFRKLRTWLALKLETGFFVNKTRSLAKKMSLLPLNSYGNFFLFFGLYTAVIYFVKLFIPFFGEADIDCLIIAIIVTIVAIPMAFSKIALAKCVKKSVIGNLIFQEALGFSENSFNNEGIKVKSRANIMLLLGFIAGISTIFVHPLIIIGAIFFGTLLCLVATAPEIGVLLTVAILPFLSFFENPTIYLCALVLITLLFYALKVIRGKRLFRFEILDLFVGLFGIFILFSGFFSAGKNASLDDCLVSVSLLIGYFLLANLMRTERWIKRCVVALVSSAAIVAFIGIIEFFLGGESNPAWLDASFSNIRLRVTSLFGNPNILATFLVMAFPFVLCLMRTAEEKNKKTLAFLISLIIIACIIFTWSRGAWLALIIGTLLFYLLAARRNFRFFGALVLIIPILPILLPSTILNRLLSITNLFDSSISYRIYTWKGTLNMIGHYLFGGIGFGNEAFETVYPYYAYSGMETAAHSHNLFLQILAGIGIFGLIVFLITLFFAFQKCFEYIKTPENHTSKIYVIATVISLLSALIMGVFDYIWYNYRVFYTFWIILAIGCAFIRVGNREFLRKQDGGEFDFEIGE